MILFFRVYLLPPAARPRPRTPSPPRTRSVTPPRRRSITPPRRRSPSPERRIVRRIVRRHRSETPPRRRYIRRYQMERAGSVTSFSSSEDLRYRAPPPPPPPQREIVRTRIVHVPRPAPPPPPPPQKEIVRTIYRAHVPSPPPEPEPVRVRYVRRSPSPPPPPEPAVRYRYVTRTLSPNRGVERREYQDYGSEPRQQNRSSYYTGRWLTRNDNYSREQHAENVTGNVVRDRDGKYYRIKKVIRRSVGNSGDERDLYGGWVGEGFSVYDCHH